MQKVSRLSNNAADRCFQLKWVMAENGSTVYNVAFLRCRWRAGLVWIVATGAAARRRPGISVSTFNPATINPQDSDVGGLRRPWVWHTVPAVSNVSAPAWPRRRHGAHDQVAQAGRRGSHLHPTQPAAGAYRRQLPGSYSPTRPRVRGDQRHQSEWRRLVRVLGRLPSTHWRLKSEWHLGLPCCHRSVLSLYLSYNISTDGLLLLECRCAFGFYFSLVLCVLLIYLYLLFMLRHRLCFIFVWIMTRMTLTRAPTC